jgi:signal transduction histidine kinase
MRILLAAALVALPSATAWAQVQTDSKHVLVLYSTRQDAPISVAGAEALPRLLDEGLQEELALYVEYIDQGRFPDAGYQSAFGDFLRVKYKGRRLDLVIAIQAAAIEFLSANKEGLFPGTPVVFLAATPLDRPIENATGVIAEPDLASTIALAERLQPEIRNVFVVSGNAVPDKRYESQARMQLQPFESRLSIAYLSGLETKDLEARLSTLPARSIVYYLTVYQDSSGETFSPSEYLRHIAAIANAPTYSWIDSVMDYGAVGGSLLDRNAMMAAVAGLSLRVLRGEQARSIPVSSPNLHVPQVDWRQLRRWGISEARVPEGTLVRFHELSAWDRYKVYILGALALLVAQTALIAGLLVQRSRRRRAEREARGSQAALRTSYERIRDLGARLLSAQETERSRIARELHDDISQQMALLAIDLELLGGAVQGHAGELAGEALNCARSVARSVHDLSHRLHPAKLRLIGLVPALHGLQRELSRTDIAISFTHDDVPSSLPPDLTLCLFRIVQEALQNALKYSGAQRVLVHLRGVPGGLALTVADDGVGFDVSAAWDKGLGLVSMGERLEAIGGTFEIHSTPGAGTRLEATVPLGVSQDTEIMAV